MKIPFFNRFVLILLLLIPAANCVGQHLEPPDGIYTSLYSFRQRTPDIPKTSLIKSLTTNSNFTIRQWVNTENLYYYGQDSTTLKFNPDLFWGYVEDGTLYLLLGSKFHRITLLGTLSYFLESYPKITNTMAPVVTDARTTSAYRILDMETGEIFDYELDQFEQLISRDLELWQEFDQLKSNKQKSRKMYSFLEKFNERNPLFQQE